MTNAHYDEIGHDYARLRHQDPDLARRIRAALGPARTVVNVGAGTGSYEPPDLHVIAVEPSSVMAAQRPPLCPAVRGIAQSLPLHDDSVDAAMTVLSMHHWHPDQALGVRELCRVARDTVVIVTVDPEVSARHWLMADYLHEVRELDLEIFPPIDAVVGWIDRDATVEIVEVRRDTPDHTLMSFWAHPERVLDLAARQVTSGFARQTDAVVQRVVTAVETDLASGIWDARHGHLHTLDAYDAGLRLIRATRA